MLEAMNSIYQVKIEALLQAARERKSSSFLIAQGESLLCEDYLDWSDNPVALRSITKSIAGLAVGLLFDQRLIDGVDTRLSDFLPAIRNSDKQTITLRHVLTHSSGLEGCSPREIEQADSALELLLAASLSGVPGEKFEYSNLAVYFISALVESLTSQTVDDYIAANIFSHLEIENYVWHRDPAGSSHCMAGLSLTARDLAKFGQLILNEGQWRGRQVLSREWMRSSTLQIQGRDPIRGYLWWLKENDLKSQTEAKSSGGDFIRYVSSDGEFGQYLIVDLLKRLVIVRQITEDDYQNDGDSFGNLRKLIFELF